MSNASRPTVIALHGFTRAPQHLQILASACNAHGWNCVRPALAPRWLPARYMSTSNLDAIADRLTERLGDSPVSIAGHSAGGAAGAYLALKLLRTGADVRGVVLIDAVDSPNQLIARSLPQLAGVRIGAVLAPPSPCNRDGALARWLEGFPAARVEVVDGAGHGDIEGGGVGIYRRACGDRSDAATVDTFMDASVGAIAWTLGLLP